MDMQERKKKRE
jgi:tetratricopeptide (TPR) repeat protein